MSYSKRKHYRLCANYVLKQLYEKNPNQDLCYTKDDWNEPNIPTLTMKEIDKRTTKYSFADLKRVIRKLEEKGYITLTNLGNPIHPNNEPAVILTLLGKDAYLDDEYHIENRKDRLESIELYTKWILPIASIIIALMAYFKK